MMPHVLLCQIENLAPWSLKALSIRPKGSSINVGPGHLTIMFNKKVDEEPLEP